MASHSPKNVRRRILTILYAHYLEDPLQMLTPTDIVEDGTVSKADLPANIFYLYDRGLIELMIGYNPPMFDAVRICPSGIDIVEDAVEFDRQFPAYSETNGRVQAEAMTLVLQLAEEADRAPLEGIKREWLLRDVRLLRDELRQPKNELRLDRVRQTLDWLPDYFDGGVGEHLPALAELRKLVAEPEGENGRSEGADT